MMFSLFNTHLGFVILAVTAGLILAAVQSNDLNREVERFNAEVQDPLRSFRFRHRAPTLLLAILAALLLLTFIFNKETPDGFVPEAEYNELSEQYDKLEAHSNDLFTENDRLISALYDLSNDAYIVSSYFDQEENAPSFDTAKESMDRIYTTLYP